MTREENIEAALFARAETMPFDTAKIAWPNEKKDPPSDGSLYVEVLHFPNKSDRFTLRGSGPEHMMGFLQLLVRAPKNSGRTEATIVAATLALHFPADLKLRSEDVIVRISKRPDVMSGSPTETSWNVPVTVYYEAFA